MIRLRRSEASLLTVVAVLLICLGLVGCWGNDPAKDGGASQAGPDKGASQTNSSGGATGNGSDKNTSTDPVKFVAAAKEDPASLASGNVQFAFDLYDQCDRQGSADNLAFAPYSIAEMLAMAYCGAHGKTASQMNQALHFGVPVERLPAAFGALDAALASAQKGDARLALACGLWTRKGMDLSSDYREHVAEPMRARAEQLDFVGDPEGSRQAVNAWVSGKTNQTVRDLMPPGAVGKDTAAVLASAVDFEAPWDRPFSARLTAAAPFHSPKGDRPTQMMTQTGRLNAYSGGGLKAVELPFLGSRVVLDLILPDAPATGGAPAVTALPHGAADLSQCVAGLHEHLVQLRLPRFQFSTRLDLAPPLAVLGVTDAFAGEADFSGLTRSKDFSLSRVLHQAVVRVNEDGMSASAATGGSVGRRPLTDDPDFEFTADRPFLFVLRDPTTGVVLFMGRVTDPE